MKRLLTLILVCIAIGVSTQAYDFKYSGIRYDIVSMSDRTVEVAASNQSAGSDGSVPYSGNVIIPEEVTYNGYSYSVIGIGQSAFVNCSGVTSVKLPGTLTYIRDEAFQVCLGLTEIEIPANVTSIGYNIFRVTGVKKIVVKCKTPPATVYNSFQYPQANNNCILYVPYGTKSLYQSASEWSKFNTIIEQEPETDTQSANGHEYVDLGLPSGKCWATTNYGTTKAEGYGNYVMWSSVDAMASNWGSNWKVPSQSDMRELINNCTWTWGSKNGVYGYNVKGKNGNSIFIPASGYKMQGQSSANQVGSWAYYWTSTYDSNDMAYILMSTSSNVYYGSFNTTITSLPVRFVYTGGGSPVVKVASISFESNGVTLKEGESYTFNPVIRPSNATNKTLAWSSSNTSVATVNNGMVKAVAPGNATITAKSTDGSNVSAICNVNVTMPPTESFASVIRLWKDGKCQEIDLNQVDSITFATVPGNIGEYHEYVDLGLSVKWATCNIGASKPEEYGDYYAWGETETKSTYNWDSYFDSYHDKYATNKKTKLDQEDDVAHVKWGGSWRMPTDAELTELRTKCSWVWTTYGGHNGYVVMGSTGNAIFLPAAGYRDDSSLSNAGSRGYYWSSSLSENLSYDAWYVNFNSDFVRSYGNYRLYGQSVRPVCP